MADASSLYLGALGAITAFIDEHKRCGDLDGGLIMQPAKEPPHPAAKPM